MPAHRISLVIVLSWILALVGCGGKQTATVSGSEVAALLPGTTGYLLMCQPPCGITAVSLPELEETIVKPANFPDAADQPTIHALSGPDAEGRIAYIEDHVFVKDQQQKRHALKTIQIDGARDTELFCRPGDAMWAKSPAGRGEIGNHLALSPQNGQIAF